MTNKCYYSRLLVLEIWPSSTYFGDEIETVLKNEEEIPSHFWCLSHTLCHAQRMNYDIMIMCLIKVKNSKRSLLDFKTVVRDGAGGA